MNLLKPRNYRLKPGQDAWLKQEALREGHGNVNLTLRALIENAQRARKRRRPRHRAA